MGEAMEFFPYNNGFSKAHYETKHLIIEKQNQDEDEDSWFEEEIDVDLKWSFSLNRYTHTHTLFSTYFVFSA